MKNNYDSDQNLERIESDNKSLKLGLTVRKSFQT